MDSSGVRTVVTAFDTLAGVDEVSLEEIFYIVEYVAPGSSLAPGVGFDDPGRWGLDAPGFWDWQCPCEFGAAIAGTAGARTMPTVATTVAAANRGDLDISLILSGVGAGVC